jgi:hypothetical protein
MIPASDIPPASELSIPSKNPSPKSPPLVELTPPPVVHTHAHGSTVEDVVVPDDPDAVYVDWGDPRGNTPTGDGGVGKGMGSIPTSTLPASISAIA